MFSLTGRTLLALNNTEEQCEVPEEVEAGVGTEAARGLRGLVESIEGAKQSLKTVVDELGGLWPKLRDHLKARVVYSDPYSAKDESAFSPQRMQAGRAKILHVLNTIERERREIKDQQLPRGDPRIFAATRRLLAETPLGNSTYVRGQIDRFWDKVADGEIDNANIDEAALQQILGERALADVQHLTKHFFGVYILNLYNYWYNATFLNSTVLSETPLGDYGGGGSFGNGAPGADGGGFEFGGTGPGGGRCRNSFKHPLKCCKVGVSPYECCFGLGILCIPPLSHDLHWQYTTTDNVQQQWVKQCRPFRSFIGWWWNFIRGIVTIVVDVLGFVLSSRNFLDRTLSFVVYPHGTLPENWGGCLVGFSSSLWIVVIIGWLVAQFFATGLLVSLVLLFTTRMQGIYYMELIESRARAEDSRKPAPSTRGGRAPPPPPPPSGLSPV
jgi:hypothetical protein